MVATALFTVSCNKEEVSTFEQAKASVRFASVKVYAEELTIGGSSYDENYGGYLYNGYSFLDSPLEDSHQVDLPLVLIGKTDKKDREVMYEIDEESTAPKGSYEVLKAVIPADSIYGYIRLKIYNDEVLVDSTYELIVRLKPSNDLGVGPSQYVTDKFSWSNQIPEPPHNHLVRTYNMLIKGMRSFVSTSRQCYSPNGLRAIVAATGWNDWDNQEVHGVKYNNPTIYKSYKYLPRFTWIYADKSYLSYAMLLDRWLKKYEKEQGKPLLHNAGALKGKPVEARQY